MLCRSCAVYILQRTSLSYLPAQCVYGLTFFPFLKIVFHKSYNLHLIAKKGTENTMDTSHKDHVLGNARQRLFNSFLSGCVVSLSYLVTLPLEWSRVRGIFGFSCRENHSFSLKCIIEQKSIVFSWCCRSRNFAVRPRTSLKSKTWFPAYLYSSRNFVVVFP